MNKTQFFKYLANGGKIQMITFHGNPVPPNSKLNGIRYAEKVQSNAIKFNGGSWLYKDDVKASDVTEVFTGNDTPSVNVGWATYKLIK